LKEEKKQKGQIYCKFSQASFGKILGGKSFLTELELPMILLIEF
jgi:hypothetical protein